MLQQFCSVDVSAEKNPKQNFQTHRPEAEEGRHLGFLLHLSCLCQVVWGTGNGPLNRPVLMLSRPMTKWSGSKQVLSGPPQLTAVTRECKSLRPSGRVIPICTSFKSTRSPSFTQPQSLVVPALRWILAFKTVKVANVKTGGEKDFLSCLSGVLLGSLLDLNQVHNLRAAFTSVLKEVVFTFLQRRAEVLHETRFYLAQWRAITWEATASL